MKQTLERILADRRWTQSDLASALGVTQATVSRWFHGSDPRGATRDQIRQLADGPSAASALIRVPLISWISAGALKETANISGWEDIPHLEMADLPPGDWIALEVGGDSMDRISPPGSIIVANRRDTRLVPNACYVIGDQDGNATYKRWRPNPSRFEPVSTNPDHEALFPTSEPTIIGRVRRSIINM
ncbi:LexA family protein [Kaistia terrae]|uniref:LexA family protein n=1 Tax=Kaistia terrae TaxID=537017 RepID=A0ABW0Q926_9HYPH|nr:S24 family peptidase [Kaistia terrae]MCX5581349.1 helix-turn-helix domain-containing protein [Kaistia terrae]